MKDKYKILSFDGGGIRGLLTAVLIRRINEKFEGWLDKTDLFAGTSTGGMIAMALAGDKNINDIINLYYNKGEEIFNKSFTGELLDFKIINVALYSNNNLEKEINNFFGNKKLGGLKKKVLVPSFHLDNKNEDKRYRSWEPKFFHNFDCEDSSGDIPCAKVGMYTSSAPIYFPTYEGYIDGGIYANNPSMLAVSLVRDKNIVKKPISLDNIQLLSLGTGFMQKVIEGENLNWGLYQWGEKVMNILIDGLMGISHYNCQNILGDRYQRFSPIFPPGEKIEMDNIAKKDRLIEFAEEVELDNVFRFVENVWLK